MIHIEIWRQPKFWTQRSPNPLFLIFRLSRIRKFKGRLLGLSSPRCLRRTALWEVCSLRGSKASRLRWPRLSFLVCRCSSNLRLAPSIILFWGYHPAGEPAQSLSQTGPLQVLGFPQFALGTVLSSPRRCALGNSIYLHFFGLKTFIN